MTSDSHAGTTETVVVSADSMIVTDVQPSQVVVGSGTKITYKGVHLGLVAKAHFKDPAGNQQTTVALSAAGGKEATCTIPASGLEAPTSGTTWLEGPNSQHSNSLPIDFITA